MNLTVFTTCPQSTDYTPESYVSRVVDVARWSERSGCSGILVYTDNSLVDPWIIAQEIIKNTESLSPLVAVQPAYMHPYAVAKIISTFGFLYQRRIYLNMVAGGFKNDLNALNDATPHDRRYDRLVEYTNVIKRLLSSEHAVTYTGKFYQIKQLKMVPALSPHLLPEILVSGSSEAGVAAARAIGAICVEYPLPSVVYNQLIKEDGTGKGIRVGIIARPKADDAWHLARARFPIDRKGQLTHQLAMKTSDSKWHQLLSDASLSNAEQDNPYWLEPFQNYESFCPYLVGSYEVVAQEIAHYMRAGYRMIILDIPTDEEELDHIGTVLQQANILTE